MSKSDLKTGNNSEIESDNDSSIISVSTGRSENSTNRRSQKVKGRKSKLKNNNNNKPLKSLYRFNCFVTEENAKQIFAIQFNHFVKDRNIFATASGYRISIYECVDDKHTDENDKDIEDIDDFCGIKLLRAYDDPDRDEVFYTLAWSYEGSCPILACGGVRSVVRAIYINDRHLKEKRFIGHTNAINEMKFHPKQPHLLLTASKDHSMRLWNIKTEICVAILGGVSGHRDEVLALDFDVHGRYCVSGGMDHNLKVWKFDTEEMESAIESSETYWDVKRVRSFPTLHIHFADFTTRSVHRNYVDSVKCFGNTFLSKSCENCIIWWKVGNLNEPFNLTATNATPIHSFDVDDCELWFVRMDLDMRQKYLAVGNSTGKIFMFDLDSEGPTDKPSILSHYKCTKPIRQVSFSRDGDILVCVCDDGKIHRWDRKE
ncbi:polycomb protein esc-like [Chironomus tepperi]|uniref:polycomb protein esc-like n=1 Tax=Chironomus tepperi TaxID=113505 RepID=UPI00391F222F